MRKIFFNGSMEKYLYDPNIDHVKKIRQKLAIDNNVPFSFIRLENADDKNLYFEMVDLPSSADTLRKDYIQAKKLFYEITEFEWGGYFATHNTGDILILKDFSKNLFLTENTLKKTIDSFLEYMEKEKNIYKQLESGKKAFIKKFSNKDNNYIVAKNTLIEMQTFFSTIENFVDDEDIFDSLITNTEVPFAFIVKQNGEKHFKVHENSPFDLEWINESRLVTEPGVYFKIGNMDRTKLLMDYLRFSTRYSNGAIKDGKVHISLNTSYGKDAKYVASILKRWHLKHTTIVPTFTDASFEVSLEHFDENIFVDYLTSETDMFFINENSKSFALKKRNTFYFGLSTLEEDYKPIPFTISILGQKKYQVKIKKCSSVEECNMIGSMICRLFTFYDRKDVVEKIEKKYLKYGIKFLEQKKGYLKKTDRSRAAILHEIFGSVSRKCSVKRQAYVIPDSKVKNFQKKHGDKSVLNYKDRNWVCYNPDTDETTKTPHPGFVLNREQGQCIPCCFEKQQFGKPKMLACEKIEKGEKVKKDRVSGLGYIIESGKDLTSDRYADTPFILKWILQSINWPIFTRKDIRKTYYTLLRYGVPDENDSIIHCFEMALGNKEYLRNKEKYVKNIRKEMAKETEMLALCKQSAFDYDIEELSEILHSEDESIDPAIFLEFLEEYYDMNCYIFTLDKKNPEGEYFLPRFKDYYINKKKNKKNTIIVVLAEMSNGETRASIMREVDFNKRADYGPFILENMKGPFRNLLLFLADIHRQIYEYVKIQE